MPIEIRELVIRATITQDNNATAQPATNTQTANASSSSEQLVDTCVEKVLEILKTKNQR